LEVEREVETVARVLEIRKKGKNMAKAKGPSFSLEASKSLKKILTFQKRPSGTALYKKSAPGGKAPFIPSVNQRNQRGIIALLVAQWQSMSPAERTSWENTAKRVDPGLTGYTYFLRTAQKNLLQYHGLVGYWGMNELDGAAVGDISGNGKNGTLSPVFPSNCPVRVEGQNSKFGKALQFDGSDDWVNVSVLLFPVADPDQLSVSVWINVKNPGKRVYDFNLDPMFLYITVGLGIEAVLYNRAGASVVLTSPSATIQVGKWHQIVVTYKSLEAKLYLDGVLKDTDAGLSGNIALQNRYFRIGGRAGGGGGYKFFSGIIDDLRFYKRVLPPVEIEKQYKMLRR